MGTHGDTWGCGDRAPWPGDTWGTGDRETQGVGQGGAVRRGCGHSGWGMPKMGAAVVTMGGACPKWAWSRPRRAGHIRSGRGIAAVAGGGDAVREWQVWVGQRAGLPHPLRPCSPWAARGRTGASRRGRGPAAAAGWKRVGAPPSTPPPPPLPEDTPSSPRTPSPVPTYLVGGDRGGQVGGQGRGGDHPAGGQAIGRRVEPAGRGVRGGGTWPAAPALPGRGGSWDTHPFCSAVAGS